MDLPRGLLEMIDDYVSEALDATGTRKSRRRYPTPLPVSAAPNSSTPSLEVGGASYAMYTQGDGIWIKNVAEEERMVAAMRKAADATVKGVSAKGTETIDTFSLKGLSQALDKIAQDCRR